MKSLSRNLIAQGLLAVTQVLFPLITLPVITSAIGAKGYGMVSFTDSIAQLTILLSSAGIPLYGIREIASNADSFISRSRIFKELFIIQSLLLIPAVALVMLISISVSLPQQLVFLAIANVILSSISCEWFLQGTDLYVKIAIRSIIIRVIGIILVITLIKNESDYILYYAILVSMVLLTSIFNLKVILSKISLTKCQTNLNRHFKRLGWVYGSYLLASLLAVTDTLLLGLISTDEAVGYYSLGYRIIRLVAMFILSLGVVFITKFSDFKTQANPVRINKFQDIAINIVLLTSLPLMIYFFIFSPEIVLFLGEDQFEETILVVRILSIVPLFLGLSHFAGVQFLLSHSRERIYFYFLAVGLIVNILSNILLIPVIHHVGAAISNLLAEGLISIGLLVYLVNKGNIKLSYFRVEHIIPIVVVIPLSFLLKSFHLPVIFTLSISAIVFITSYGLLLKYFAKKIKSLNIEY